MFYNKTMATIVSELESDVFAPQVLTINGGNASSYILDFSLSIEDRMLALLIYSDLVDEERFSELLSRIISIFTISNSFTIREYIAAICSETRLSLDLRCELAKNFTLLKPADDPQDLFFRPLYLVCSELDMDGCPINTAKKIDLYALLMQSKEYKAYGSQFFNRLVNDKTLASLFRYKSILSLKTFFGLYNNADNLRHFQTSALLSFMAGDNGVNEQILAAQYLLSARTQGDLEEEYAACIDTMVRISSTAENSYKSRADAVDVLLKYGRDGVGKEMLDKLIIIGNDNKRPLNIYQNPQNAHSETIEASANRILEMLISIPVQPDIDYQYVRNEIIKLNGEVITLDRIDLDTALYTKYNTTLKSALVHMYSFIQTQDDSLKDILLHRLIEELAESSGLCSTGIFERIMNSVSGFVGDLKITISFEDQISGNLTGRLNARIRDISTGRECLHATTFCNCSENVCTYSYTKKFMPHRLRRIKTDACGTCYYCNGDKCTHTCASGMSCNTEFMHLILEEMIVPTHAYEKRRNFLKFFRYILPNIIEELKSEFRPYIDDATFELYMRKAILAYEGDN